MTATAQAPFIDSRDLYQAFVGSTNEKEVIAARIGEELHHIHPRGQALRFFDAGIGSGDVLLRVLEKASTHFPEMAFRVVGKEISNADVIQTLGKMPGFFADHPATSMVLTNLPFKTATSLKSDNIIRHEVILRGTKPGGFRDQLDALKPKLAQIWGTIPKTDGSGGVDPEHQVVLTIHRADQTEKLNGLVPGTHIDDGHDLIIASQPYRSRLEPEKKALWVINPLVASLAPGGRLIGFHAQGSDTAHAVINSLWGHERPFTNNNARAIFAQASQKLCGTGKKFEAHEFHLTTGSIEYGLLPILNDQPGSLNDSRTASAFKAALYVAQMDPAVASQISRGDALGTTRAVLDEANDRVAFRNEVYVIHRKPSELVS